MLITKKHVIITTLSTAFLTSSVYTSFVCLTLYRLHMAQYIHIPLIDKIQNKTNY